jgi:hypothetical protein
MTGRSDKSACNGNLQSPTRRLCKLMEGMLAVSWNLRVTRFGRHSADVWAEYDFKESSSGHCWPIGLGTASRDHVWRIGKYKGCALIHVELPCLDGIQLYTIIGIGKRTAGAS